MEPEVVPVKGRARLLVADDVVNMAPTRIEKPKSGVIIWDVMEAQELFDAFASFLRLPETFAILGVFFDATFYQWFLVIESAEFPVPDPAMMLPILHCIYQRAEDGKARLIDYHLGR